MKNVISFIFGALLFLVLLLFLHSNLDNYKNIAKAYETNRDNFESVANELMNYTEDIYIDKDNVSDVGKVLNDKYGINLSIEKINIIFKNKFKSITKRGNSILFYRGNLNKNYVGIRAYGIAYFKYYFATNEPTHELITAIRALDEKNGWYYYEQR